VRRKPGSGAYWAYGWYIAFCGREPSGDLGRERIVAAWRPVYAVVRHVEGAGYE
jgi:hypothetical protein